MMHFTSGWIRWLKFNAVGGIGILVQLGTLTQPSQLRTCSGFFAMNFIAKSCVPFVAL